MLNRGMEAQDLRACPNRRSITLELQSQGYRISRINAALCMKQLGPHGKLSRKFKVTNNSKHNHFVVPNAIKRGFAAAKPAKPWFSSVACYAYTG
jgi:putative transposase